MSTVMSSKMPSFDIILIQAGGFDCILGVPFPEILSSLLTNCQLEDKIGNIVDVYLPFIRELEDFTNQSVDIAKIVQEYVIVISRDSLLPLLQVLQSHVSHVTFSVFIPQLSLS